MYRYTFRLAHSAQFKSLAGQLDLLDSYAISGLCVPCP